MSTIREIAMFMLYITLAGLILANAGGFAEVLNAIGTNWTRTLRVLQGEGARRA